MHKKNALQDHTPLNRNELKSITALIAYTSYYQGLKEDFVKSLLESRFSVDDYKKIPSQNYDDALHYLVDLKISEEQVCLFNG